MTTFNNNFRGALAAAIASCFLVACGGGGGSSNSSGGVVTPSSPTTPPIPTGTTVDTVKIAADGLAWINSRRAQLGVPLVTQNAQISTAAQAHSDYQKINNIVSHSETAGLSGFTGVDLQSRLAAAGYVINANNSYAFGEIISATNSTSGQFMAEQLVTAIYHRFVMFEPVFKDIGAGAATNTAGYSYFTADLAANNGYGPGVGSTTIVTWPFSGQTGVPTDFFSDNEEPDPVPEANEVGYPISVHANISSIVTVQSFTVRQHGASADLPVKLLINSTDTNTPKATPQSAAAIIPMAVLTANTTYDVTFVGTVGPASPVGVTPTPVTKTWSFTTGP